MDEDSLARHWGAFVARGVLAILFGVLVLIWPGAFWFALVITFAAYSLLFGVLAIAAAVSGDRRAGPWWALLLQGLVSIAAAAVAVVWTGITELALLYLIAGWCVATGLFEVVTAIWLWRVRTGPALARSPHWAARRQPYLLETSRPGVFAAGDVRAGSVKRVASAVGEGAMAVQLVHEYLKEM
jgi:Short repeat of unknown function (DUF308)